MKKTTQTILVSLLVLVFLLFFTECTDNISDANETNRAAYTSEDNGLSKRDAKIYSNAVIEDDFDDSSLVVILDNLTGGINKKHEESFLIQPKSTSFHEYRKEKFFSGKPPKYTGFTPPCAMYCV